LAGILNQRKVIEELAWLGYKQEAIAEIIKKEYPFDTVEKPSRNIQEMKDKLVQNGKSAKMYESFKPELYSVWKQWDYNKITCFPFHNDNNSYYLND
jgi:hypothetical protein